MTSKGSTVEMTGRGNRGKPNSGLPLFPPPLEIAKTAISTFPQRRLRFSFLRTYEPTTNEPLAPFGCSRNKKTQKGAICKLFESMLLSDQLQAHLALEATLSFRLTPHWNHFLLSGSLLDWKMLRGGIVQRAVGPIVTEYERAVGEAVTYL